MGMGNETMYWLAENYWIGIGIISGIFILIYILTAVLILIKSRKMGVNVSIGAMIPLWNVKYPIQGIIAKHPKKPKAVKVEEGTEGDSAGKMPGKKG